MAAVTIGEAFQQAVAHHQAGRLAEAEGIYRQILSVHPRHSGALHLLGVVALQLGRNDLAVEWIERAIAIAPESSDFHSNLGAAYRNLGRLEDAVAACGRAIQLNPDSADAHSNLAGAFLALGRPAEAEAACRCAIAAKPNHAGAYHNLGLALRNQQRLDESVEACRCAIHLRPADAEAHNNLGVAQADHGQFDEAIASFRRAIELQPAYADACSNLAAALANSGHYEEAATTYRCALEFRPDFPQARFNYAELLLLRGDYENGWPLFESRWNVGPMRLANKDARFRRWNGEPLHGQRVLVHAEQGFGDTLQFVRYVPLIAERGGRVIVECQPELRALLESVEGVSEIVTRGEALPVFDLHCPMMSLPLVFGTRMETIPRKVPYLRADATRIARWKERLEMATGTQDEVRGGRRPILKVGLTWAGGHCPDLPDHARIDRRRSLNLTELSPIATVPDVVFVSLQKGAAATQAQFPPLGMHLLDWTAELHDFSQSAELVTCLDLVISVDTAMAHLAGALGKPIWLLNRFDTCWRWLVDREDSPWYPTMRVFRQPQFGDWSSVIRRTTDALDTLVH